MTRMTIHFLQLACLFVLLMILVDASAAIFHRTNIGPPPVPLDPQGNMAPYYESPFPI